MMDTNSGISVSTIKGKKKDQASNKPRFIYFPAIYQIYKQSGMYREFQTTTNQVVDGTETVVHPSSWNQREKEIHLSGWTHI